MKNLSEEKIINWKITEYEKHYRSKKWYIVAIAFAFSLLLFSFFTSNFLFAVIILITTIIIILHEGQTPALINILIESEGIIIGKKFYDYDELENFSVIYKPKQDIKKLYFEFKNTMYPRISISISDIDPVLIRKTLLKYLPEDLERTDQSFSENLAQILKI